MTAILLDRVRRLAQVATWIGGFALIVVALLVTAEVILRKLFLVGLSVATELSAYALAVSTAWAYSYALLERNHVRVDAVVRLLPRRLVVWVDLAALLALSWFAGMLVYHGAGVLNASLQRNAHAMTPLETPMWIPQGLWVLGLAIFFLTCLVVLARAVRLIAAGQVDDASALIGTFSREQEAESEAEQAVLRASQTPRE